MSGIHAITRASMPRSRRACVVGSAWLISCAGAEADELAGDPPGDVDREVAAARTDDDTTTALQLKRQDPANYDASLRALEGPESICGPTNDMEPVNAYAGDLGVSKEYVRGHKGPVGAMATLGRADAGWKFCSGTLVATNVFLTASHCVDWQTVGRYVAMNYELDQGEGTTLRDQKFYRISRVLVDDIDRDFALLRLDGDPGGQFGWADIRETDATVGEAIAIIQHPAGEPKQIEAGLVSELSPARLYYEDIDTLPGSSGSGVLDAGGLLVGIHTTGGCAPGGEGRNSGPRMTYALNASSELREISRGSHWQADLGWCAHPGAQGFVGDFDGDDQDDLLCHDQAGNSWVTLADASGHFTGETWRSPTKWCGQTDARLLVGDFNGDGRDDMLCHDKAGDDSVALADEFGRFTGTSGSAQTAWCDQEGAQLFVGDFNGDGRDDMLCHDQLGSTWITLADPAGAFSEDSWFEPMGWCHHEGAQLFIGDFNGDDRDDMLCHDSAGDHSVALADESGEFSGTSWHAAKRWCDSEGAQLFVGDFNGDGRDDMLCHDPAGDTSLALADTSGHFPGTSWNAPMAWCTVPGGELYIGQFNTDSRADMLCHNTSGYVWISNAREDGSF